MINLLRPYTWSKFYRGSGDVSSSHITYKRQLLLSQLAIVSIIVATAHLFLDITTGHPITVVLDLIIIAVLLFGYLANEKGYNTLAKVVITIFMNVIIFVYANIIPKENGIFFLFFPLVSLYFVVFDHKDHLKRYIFLAISICLFLVLEFHDYKIFGSHKMVEQPDFFSYLLNYFSAVAILFFSYNFIVKSNFKAEQELRRQSKKILRQNHDLEKTNRELDLFVYRSSHDIKAPLASIQGLLNLLNKEVLNTNQKEYISRIEDRVIKLENFISEITLYSRNARLDLQPEIINVKSLIDEVIESHQYYKFSDRIRVVVENYIDQPIMADRSRLLTVINNLYSNAIKYHHLNQADPVICIRCLVENQILHFQISDNGPGIDLGIQDKVFNMFFRGNEASDGSGLGLFIVKEVVEKMNGKIKLGPNHPTGCVFSISFPIELVNEKPVLVN